MNSPPPFDPQQLRDAASEIIINVRELAAAGIDHALVSPRHAWGEATFDAVAAILPDVHAIEPERG